MINTQAHPSTVPVSASWNYTTLGSVSTGGIVTATRKDAGDTKGESTGGTGIRGLGCRWTPPTRRVAYVASITVEPRHPPVNS